MGIPLAIRESDYLPHQYDFLVCPHKIKALVSGYGGGKTFVFLRECLKQHITNRRDSDGLSAGWVIYPTLELARDLFIDDFKALLEKKQIKYTYTDKDMVFKTVYGKIKIYTLEKPERMVGSNLTWVGIDEFDTTREKNSLAAYKKCLARLRGNEKACLFIVTTPEGFKTTYKIFVEEANKDKMIIHAKTTDNPHLPQSYIDMLYQEYDEKLIKAYINGEFVNLNSGSVYYAFEREKNVVDNTFEIDKNIPLNIFFDFNVYPMSCGWGQDTCIEDIRIIDEIVMKGHSCTEEVCKEIKKRLPRDLDVVIYGDASGTFFNVNSNKSSYQIIDNELRPHFNSIKYQVPKANGSVRHRVDCVNARLSKQHLKVNKRCVKLIADYEQVCYTEKGDIDGSNIERTHISDASGYYVNVKYPIIKPTLSRTETTQT